MLPLARNSLYAAPLRLWYSFSRLSELPWPTSGSRWPSPFEFGIHQEPEQEPKLRSLSTPELGRERCWARPHSLPPDFPVPGSPQFVADIHSSSLQEIGVNLDSQPR